MTTLTDRALKDCVDWVQQNPENAAEKTWALLQRLPFVADPFFDHLETLSNGNLDRESMKTLVNNEATIQSYQTPAPRPRPQAHARGLSAPSSMSLPIRLSSSTQMTDAGSNSSRSRLVEVQQSLTPQTRAPTPAPQTSSAPSSYRPEASQSSSELSVSSKYLDPEVKAFVERCDQSPGDFITSNDKLFDVGEIGVSALLRNVKKLQRHMKLDRVRLRMHRYVLYILFQHIKSGLESNYAVKQYLNKITPNEPFFPGRNDKAFAGKYAKWVTEFGGPGVLFCNIKIDDRDSPQQGPRREHFIKTHIDAGILLVVQQLNAVAYKVCNDLWTKTVTWLNQHGDIQWRTTFPEGASYGVQAGAGLLATPMTMPMRQMRHSIDMSSAGQFPFSDLAVPNRISSIPSHVTMPRRISAPPPASANLLTQEQLASFASPARSFTAPTPANQPIFTLVDRTRKRTLDEEGPQANKRSASHSRERVPERVAERVPERIATPAPATLGQAVHAIPQAAPAFAESNIFTDYFTGVQSCGSEQDLSAFINPANMSLSSHVDLSSASVPGEQNLSAFSSAPASSHHVAAPSQINLLNTPVNIAHDPTSDLDAVPPLTLEESPEDFGDQFDLSAFAAQTLPIPNEAFDQKTSLAIPENFPSLQLTSATPIDFQQYLNDSYDPFNYNLNDGGMEQDYIMSLLASGGWMDDMVQENNGFVAQ